MFSWFERRVDPYPQDPPGLPPKGLLAFCWHYTKPTAPWLLLLGICSMVIAIAEVKGVMPEADPHFGEDDHHEEHAAQAPTAATAEAE